MKCLLYILMTLKNDLNNTSQLDPYRNEVPDVLYAKVTQANATCYSMGSITLHANEKYYYPKPCLPVI
jgi:hypothetical protein